MNIGFGLVIAAMEARATGPSGAWSSDLSFIAWLGNYLVARLPGLDEGGRSLEV
jgi:hypothetical protein